MRQRRQSDGKKESVDKGMASVLHVFAAVCLGDESIQPEKQARAKNCHDVIQALAQTGSADRDSAVRKTADHDRVNHSHRHPADLGKHQR